MLSVGAPPDAVKVIDLLEAGGHFGLAAAILDAPQAVTAETLTDCTLLLVPRAALLAQLPEHAEFSLQLALALSRENAALIDDIEAHALRSGRQRVAGYLLHVCSGAKSRPFPLPARKSVIASRLGLTPEYFSRMLHELIVAGAIRVAGRHITILDAARMRDTGGAAAHG